MFRKLAGLALVASLFVSGSAFAGIATSAHDFTAEFSTGDICVVCHAPHDNLNDNGDLLWNHTATGTTFQAYSSPSLDGTGGLPTGISLLCLGCHDGTVGADAYGGAAGTDANKVGFAGGAFETLAAFGADMGNDHPIAITYEPSADTELKALGDPAAFVAGGAGTVDDLVFGDEGTETQTVECGSCHDVHDTRSDGTASLLVIANTNSALCLTCHNK